MIAPDVKFKLSLSMSKFHNKFIQHSQVKVHRCICLALPTIGQLGQDKLHGRPLQNMLTGTVCERRKFVGMGLPKEGSSTRLKHFTSQFLVFLRRISGLLDAGESRGGSDISWSAMSYRSLRRLGSPSIRLARHLLVSFFNSLI